MNLGLYEIMERTHLLQEALENSLAEHPDMTESMSWNLNATQSHLSAIYQEAATAFDGTQPDSPFALESSAPSEETK